MNPNPKTFPRKLAMPAALLALIFTFLFAGAPAALAQGDNLWLHVTVHEGEGGDNVSINMPFSVVDKAIPMIPEGQLEGGKLKLENEEIDVAQLRELWTAIKDSPDMNFVTVDGTDEKVRVSKAGAYMLVKVEEGDEGGAHVDIKVPMAVVEALLSGEGDTLDVAAAIRALADHGAGELVTVTEADSHVRVWIDDRPEAR